MDHNILKGKKSTTFNERPICVIKACKAEGGEGLKTFLYFLNFFLKNQQGRERDERSEFIFKELHLINIPDKYSALLSSSKAMSQFF